MIIPPNGFFCFHRTTSSELAFHQFGNRYIEASTEDICYPDLAEEAVSEDRIEFQDLEGLP